jgi:hypothetical protein
MQTTQNPSEGYKPSPKTRTAWCPYCGKESLFGHDARLNNARCMGCGISERDFYVRRFNDLWDDKVLGTFVAEVIRCNPPPAP